MVDYRDTDAFREAMAENHRRSRVMENQPAGLPPSPAVDTLAANLRSHRERLGLTVGELAERAGVRATYLADLEASRLDPTIQAIASLARQLDVHPWLLLLDHGALAERLGGDPVDLLTRQAWDDPA